MNHLLKSKKVFAFTLMEVLLVSSIVAILTLSLYRALSVGLKVWERSQKFSVEEDAMIFFDKLSMDLRNAINFSLFEFDGETARVAFSTIVSVPMGHDQTGDIETYVDQIGRVEYGYDMATKAIYRRVANYSQALDDKFGATKKIVSFVTGLQFEYFVRGLQGLAERKLEQDMLPDAMQVTVYYKNEQGQQQSLKRLINLPLYF